MNSKESQYPIIQSFILSRRVIPLHFQRQIVAIHQNYIFLGFYNGGSLLHIPSEESGTILYCLTQE